MRVYFMPLWQPVAAERQTLAPVRFIRVLLGVIPPPSPLLQRLPDRVMWPTRVDGVFL